MHSFGPELETSHKPSLTCRMMAVQLSSVSLPWMLSLFPGALMFIWPLAPAGETSQVSDSISSCLVFSSKTRLNSHLQRPSSCRRASSSTRRCLWRRRAAPGVTRWRQQSVAATASPRYRRTSSTLGSLTKVFIQSD